MGTRPPLVIKEIYHVYNRGNDKRKVFLDKKDHERFVALLYLSNGTTSVHISNHQGSTLMELLELEKGEPLVDIAAYCLMPNHFHLLLHQKVDGGISKFMQKLTTGYTMYFNTKYKRSGTLFQGKFKSRHAGEDRYLKYLLSYIHLNPPKYATYPYSSYLDFTDTNRIQHKILNRQCLPLYFSSTKKFVAELKEWSKYREEYQGSTLMT
jgi:putative transposase